MFHLNDRTLERLITGTASGIEVDRVKRHADECRACSRRLEEWRDNFGELDRNFPQLASDAAPVATMTAGGLVVLPPEEPRRGFRLDLATVLWGLAAVLALVDGYGVFRLGADPGDGSEVVVRLDAQPPRPAPGPAPFIGLHDTLLGAEPADGSPRPAGRAPRDSAPAPLGVSPRFRAAQRVEAARVLGGALRGVTGLTPDHYEIGPPGAVPGAQRNIDVVRVVYRTGGGGRLTLDQQLIPVDASGFRPIDDTALESGETIFRDTPDGGTSATWLDEAGYRISLSARISQDSLRKLVPRVQ